MADARLDGPDLLDVILAEELADAADAETLWLFEGADFDVQMKADGTHVTEADLAAERAIRAILEQRREDDAILGEEFGDQGPAHRRWVIDPIDGTANFLRGVPLWGTMIGLQIDGENVLGVVSCPALDDRWVARVGFGAWKNETRVEVSKVSSLGDASVSFQSIRQWDDAGRLPQLTALSRRVWRDRAYGDVWAYMQLAEGHIDAVVEFGLKEYDIAAAAAIVTAAGGRVTAIDGSDDLTTGSTLATNGLLHDECVAFFREAPLQETPLRETP